MQFSLAFLESDNQLNIREFSNNHEIISHALDLDELNEKNIQGILFNKDQISQDSLDQLEIEDRFCPIRSTNSQSLTFEDFNKIDYENAKKTLISMHNNWLLKKNISLLSDLFKTIDQLTELWPNDRSSFFEELWFILRSNLGTKSLKIIYNDVKVATKTGEKPKLVHSQVEGEKIPNTHSGSEIEKKLMENYQREFGPHFEIIEFSQERGELVAVASINQGPILIMAKLFQLTPLQIALIRTLFDGLQTS